MRKFVKLLVALVIILIVLPAAGLLVLTQFIDPNDYKADIEALAAQHTRGKLTLEGQLGWSLFPTLGITSGALQFRLPEDGEQPFARLNNATLGVQLMPLLHGEIAADTVAFDGVQLQLVADKQGVGNWTRIARNATTPSPADSSTDAGNTAAGAALALSIQRIVLSNAVIHYHDLAANTEYSIDPLQLNVANVNLSGHTMPVSIKAELAGSALGDRHIPLSLDTQLQWQADKGWLQLDQLAISFANFALNGDIGLAIQGPLQVSGSFKVTPFSVPELLQALGQTLPAMNDPQALTHVAVEGTFLDTPNSLMLSPFAITLDDAVLKGQAGISNLSSKRIVVELKGNRLDADRYQAKANAEESTNKPAATTATNSNTALLPVALLRQQDFSIKLALDELIVSKLHLQQLQLAAHGAKGIITLDHLDANLYEGKLNTTALLDVSGDTPQVTLTENMNGIQVGPLLQDFQGTRPFDGKANLKLELKTAGNSVDAFKRHLSGPVSVVMQDGILHDVSLEQITCQAIALANKQKSTATWPQQSSIDRISMNLLFKDGIGVTQDFKGNLPQLRALGDGAVSLPEDRFDFHVGVAVTGDLSGTDAACAINEEWRDLVWPLRCQGTFGGEATSTECGLDNSRMSALLEKLARKEIKRSLEKKASDKLGGNLDALKGLFGR